MRFGMHRNYLPLPISVEVTEIARRSKKESFISQVNSSRTFCQSVWGPGGGGCHAVDFVTITVVHNSHRAVAWLQQHLDHVAIWKQTYPELKVSIWFAATVTAFQVSAWTVPWRMSPLTTAYQLCQATAGFPHSFQIQLKCNFELGSKISGAAWLFQQFAWDCRYPKGPKYTEVLCKPGFNTPTDFPLKYLE